jgi:hypothetical protein
MVGDDRMSPVGEKFTWFFRRQCWSLGGLVDRSFFLSLLSLRELGGVATPRVSSVLGEHTLAPLRPLKQELLSKELGM